MANILLMHGLDNFLNLNLGIYINHCLTTKSWGEFYLDASRCSSARNNLSVLTIFLKNVELNEGDVLIGIRLNNVIPAICVLPELCTLCYQNRHIQEIPMKWVNEPFMSGYIVKPTGRERNE